MRTTEVYFQNQAKKQRQNRVEEDLYADFYEQETAPVVMGDLNSRKSVFQESVFRGINSEDSIFDKTAVFHT